MAIEAGITVVTRHITRQQFLAQRVVAYQQRTGRIDGLDFIRDELARYGVQRFSEIDHEVTRMEITMKIAAKLDEAA